MKIPKGKFKIPGKGELNDRQIANKIARQRGGKFVDFNGYLEITKEDCKLYETIQDYLGEHIEQTKD